MNGWISVWGGEEQLYRPEGPAHGREEREIARNGYPWAWDKSSAHCFCWQRRGNARKEGMTFSSPEGLTNWSAERTEEDWEDREGSPSLAKGWPSWSQTVGISSDEAQEQKRTVIVLWMGVRDACHILPKPHRKPSRSRIQLCNTQVMWFTLRKKVFV